MSRQETALFWRGGRKLPSNKKAIRVLSKDGDQISIDVDLSCYPWCSGSGLSSYCLRTALLLFPFSLSSSSIISSLFLHTTCPSWFVLSCWKNRWAFSKLSFPACCSFILHFMFCLFSMSPCFPVIPATSTLPTVFHPSIHPFVFLWHNPSHLSTHSSPHLPP